MVKETKASPGLSGEIKLNDSAILHVPEGEPSEGPATAGDDIGTRREALTDSKHGVSSGVQAPPEHIPGVKADHIGWDPRKKS